MEFINEFIYVILDCIQMCAEQDKISIAKYFLNQNFTDTGKAHVQLNFTDSK